MAETVLTYLWQSCLGKCWNEMRLGIVTDGRIILDLVCDGMDRHWCRQALDSWRLRQTDRQTDNVLWCYRCWHADACSGMQAGRSESCCCQRTVGLSCLRATARLTTDGEVVTWRDVLYLTFLLKLTEIRVFDESEQMSRHFTWGAVYFRDWPFHLRSYSACELRTEAWQTNIPTSCLSRDAYRTQHIQPVFR
jgi:hypothetical protein